MPETLSPHEMPHRWIFKIMMENSGSGYTGLMCLDFLEFSQFAKEYFFIFQMQLTGFMRDF
jgi:hypothetical protein